MDEVRTAILDPMIGWIVLAAFSVLWILLGWWFGRDSEDLEGFMLAGRRVGLALGVATAMATWVTSNTTMAAPQLALQLGLWGMIGYIIFISGTILELFGFPVGVLLALPGGLFELSLSVWLIAKGFNSASIASAATNDNTWQQWQGQMPVIYNKAESL